MISIWVAVMLTTLSASLGTMFGYIIGRSEGSQGTNGMETSIGTQTAEDHQQGARDSWEYAKPKKKEMRNLFRSTVRSI